MRCLCEKFPTQPVATEDTHWALCNLSASRSQSLASHSAPPPPSFPIGTLLSQLADVRLSAAELVDEVQSVQSRRLSPEAIDAAVSPHFAAMAAALRKLDSLSSALPDPCPSSPPRLRSV